MFFWESPDWYGLMFPHWNLGCLPGPWWRGEWWKYKGASAWTHKNQMVWLAVFNKTFFFCRFLLWVCCWWAWWIFSSCPVGSSVDVYFSKKKAPGFFTRRRAFFCKNEVRIRRELWNKVAPPFLDLAPQAVGFWACLGGALDRGCGSHFSGLLARCQLFSFHRRRTGAGPMLSPDTNYGAVWSGFNTRVLFRMFFQR